MKSGLFVQIFGWSDKSCDLTSPAHVIQTQLLYFHSKCSRLVNHWNLRLKHLDFERLWKPNNFFFVTCCPNQTQFYCHIIGYIPCHVGIIFDIALAHCLNKVKVSNLNEYWFLRLVFDVISLVSLTFR